MTAIDLLFVNQALTPPRHRRHTRRRHWTRIADFVLTLLGVTTAGALAGKIFW